MTPVSTLLQSFLDALKVFQPAFTEPSYRHLIALVVGWVLTMGRHSVTEALVTTGVASRRHYEAFHRFFSRGTWSPDELGRLLFGWIVRRIAPDAPIRLVVDDTLASKKGAKVFGICSHLDAVRSTKRRKVFSFGHCWVTTAVLVTVPFSRRPWALPLLFRLYRNKKDCTKRNQPYKKKTELAREMVDIVVGWAEGRRIELAADSAYCNNTVTRGLSPTVMLFGSMRPDAVLTAAPQVQEKKAGRPPQRGLLLPKPEALAKDDQYPWQTCIAMLYGQQTTVRHKECVAQWYRACGFRLLRIVIVATPKGAIPIRVFFCMDASLSVRDVTSQKVVAALLPGAIRWGLAQRRGGAECLAAQAYLPPRNRPAR
jgi:hypothetical protein